MNIINRKFWENKRVLITGHTGFKGGWLSLLVQHLGGNVLGIGLPPKTSPSLFEKAKVYEHIKSEIIDIRSLNTLSKTIQEFKPEIVFHLAAQPLVRYSYKNPIETYETNILGTINLFESLKDVDEVRVVINVTTDKCYENKEWNWGYRETDELGGSDPYSSSKACVEIISNAYRSSFLKDRNILLATARAGNVVGGGDWSEDRLIPDIIRNFTNKTTLIIRKKNSIRPWQHVLDPLSGYIILAENLYQNGSDFEGAWNFGPEKESAKSVEWIVEEMRKKWPDKTAWIAKEDHDYNETNILRLDVNKANQKLGWQQKWSIDQTLEGIMEWHNVEMNGGDLRDITIKQIIKYIGP
jgi:CDP-glucose 4,6-dehydratase